ncbi:MAG: mechanosensitive ion channel domain-containing protein, partial [Acidobacteriota bacterium]
MTPPEQPAFADRLSSDVRSLIETLSSPWTWILTVVLIAMLLGAWRLRLAIGQERRLTPRVRAVVSASLNATTVAIVAIVVIWFLWRRAPLLLGISLAVLAAAGGLGIALRGRAWVWGLVMIWRGRVRIGDRLRFGAVDGIVADVGIFGITVIGDDGARVFVPNAKLAGDTFSVASPESAHPADITVHAGERELTEADLERLRRIALLCPYRHSGGLVGVHASEDRRSATVTFRSWSEEGAQLAR